MEEDVPELVRVNELRRRRGGGKRGLEERGFRDSKRVRVSFGIERGILE